MVASCLPGVGVSLFRFGFVLRVLDLLWVLDLCWGSWLGLVSWFAQSLLVCGFRLSVCCLCLCAAVVGFAIGLGFVDGCCCLVVCACGLLFVGDC